MIYAILQVFHSLLKAHASEAKLVIRQALDILTPTFATRTEEGYITLATWTKKILIEEHHLVPQLAHIIYIIVKYHKVFYFIRHMLINHLIGSFQKVYYSVNYPAENRSLAIELCETILRWEAQRIRDLESYQLAAADPLQQQTKAHFDTLLLKHPDLFKPFDKHVADCLLNFFIRCQTTSDQQQQQQQQQMYNTPQQSQQFTQNEPLSKKCLTLFQTAIANDLWPNAEIKLEVIDRIMQTLESTHGTNPLIQQQQQQQYYATGSVPPAASVQPQAPTSPVNYASICTCIEIITILVEHTNPSNRAKFQHIFRSINRGMSDCLTSTNSMVVQAVGRLVQKLMSILPIEIFNNNPALSVSPSTAESQTQPAVATTAQNDPIYHLFGQPEGVLCRTIIEALSYYEKTTSMPISNESTLATLNHAMEILANCLLLLKSASVNNPQYIDRLMVPFMKILQKLYRDHLNATGSLASNPITNKSTVLVHLPVSSSSMEGSNVLNLSTNQSMQAYSELLIQSIDLIKFRVGVMSLEMRKAFLKTILVTLIDKSMDTRLIRYLVRIISEWIRFVLTFSSSKGHYRIEKIIYFDTVFFKVLKVDFFLKYNIVFFKQ